MEVGFRDGNIVFLHSPNRRDDLALHLAVTDSEKARVGHQGGYQHFGITVKDRSQLDACNALAVAAGGTLVDKGEHAPGGPYAVHRRSRRLRHRGLRSWCNHGVGWTLDIPRCCGSTALLSVIAPRGRVVLVRSLAPERRSPLQ